MLFRSWNDVMYTVVNRMIQSNVRNSVPGISMNPIYCKVRVEFFFAYVVFD